MDRSPASLYVVATPLGNLADLSSRAIETLRLADFWIVEDTRVSAKLQQHLDIKKPMQVMNEHTGPGKLQTYIDRLLAGESAAILTDAGTPVISDPGSLLIDQCYENNILVDAIPGPSAVTTALMLSGFFAQRYCFLGYLGRKAGAIKSELKHFEQSTMTLVLFESPFRFRELLEVAFEVLGPRRYAICREMTKMHQQVFRGILPELPSEQQVPEKGEFTLVVEGYRRRQ
jgi:16S rRNA (cytidine1402-2'-O)-methyltransferase